jgi:hypothetical protein
MSSDAVAGRQAEEKKGYDEQPCQRVLLRCLYGGWVVDQRV